MVPLSPQAELIQIKAACSGEISLAVPLYGTLFLDKEHQI
jgi:hypothetical protein